MKKSAWKRMSLACLSASLLFSASANAANISYDTKYNGHCYKLFNDGTTWEQAKAACERQGGHLVSITSAQEQAVVENLLRNKGNKNNYWLGGYRNGNTWTWVTGERFSYTHWSGGQPDNFQGRENRLSMYRNRNPYGYNNLGEWNDSAADGVCNNEPFFGAANFGYICEWDSDPNINNSVDGRVRGDVNSNGRITVINSTNSVSRNQTSVNHNPQGNLESCQPLQNAIRVIGYAYDEDDMNHKVKVHVYIDGTAGSSTVPSYEIRANKFHGRYNGHGFDDTIQVPAQWCGRRTIRLYALNDVGSGTFQEIGSQVVNIPGGTLPDSKTIKDGWYNIRPAHDQSRSLDSYGPNNNLHMWENISDPQQKFYLQNRGNGYFSLRSGGNGLYITAAGRGRGANLMMRAWNGSDEQLFYLTDGGVVDGNQTYHIMAKVGFNLEFDCAGGFKQNSTNAQLWTHENTNWHKWTFTEPETNYQGGNAQDYDMKVRNFINDSKYRHNSDKRWDCFQYATQFIKNVYNLSAVRGDGKQFQSPSEIKNGDVIHVNGGSHWVVVLYRNGNKLTTIEGNWTPPKVNGLGKTRYSEVAYTVQNNCLYHNGKVFRTWECGYHYN